MTEKQRILEFIKRHTIMVISTVGPQEQPEAAVVEFGETGNLELIFDTLNTSRKYANILKNPQVACVIGWDDDVTIQYEGRAVELTKETEVPYKEAYFKKNPGVQKWEKVKEVRFFKVTPKWIRYSDLKVNPWDVKEILF